MSTTRWFLDWDFNSNAVMIPVARRAEWNEWLRLAEYAPKPRLPRYAKRVTRSAAVEFARPTIYRGRVK